LKHVFSRSIALFGAAFLTIALSYGVANAQCYDVVAASDGSWSCDLEGSGPGYCSYSCDCGSLSGSECDRRLHDAGFEIEGIDY
jgi:hypothetical protein